MLELSPRGWSRAWKNSVLVRERFTKNTCGEGNFTENTGMLNLAC